MLMRRGDIVYIQNESYKHTGCEQTISRPAVIVSNDKCNIYSPVIEVVFLTANIYKKKLPTHVVIYSSERTSIALCEAVYSVDKSRIKAHIGKLSDYEMRKIDRALKISLGLN